MATIKVKFKTSTLEEQKGTLYYQIIHNHKTKLIKTAYQLYNKEWSHQNACIVYLTANTKRRKTLEQIEKHLSSGIKRGNQIITEFNSKGIAFSVNDIATVFLSIADQNSLCLFMQNIISQLKQYAQLRTSETYATTLSMVLKFNEGNDILLDEIDSDLMKTLEAYLKHKNLSMNTISFYMRILRAVYNRAVEKEIIPQRYPFKQVYTGIEKTTKRALPLETIKQIKNMNLEHSHSKEYARDLFLFSFYTRGMSFVDMAFLKKKDLEKGILSYRRKKTGQLLFIKWENHMQEIVSKYAIKQSPYLLPIIRTWDTDERRQYKNAIYAINHQLKNIGASLSLPVPLTLYVARHSWASIAKSKKIPISIISEGMGHDSEKTTQIYLASLDTAEIDKANRLIINSL